MMQKRRKKADVQVAYSYFTGTTNAGDISSCPRLYFDLPDGPEVKIGRPIQGADVVIYGGGAISDGLGRAVLRCDAPIKIAWGGGSTLRNSSMPTPRPDGFDLYGSRDYVPASARDWLPCVSCMSPEFDRRLKVDRKFGFVFNADPDIERPDVDLPSIGNDRPFVDLVRFIGSSETVVTNSYHAAYWATLMGRKAVIMGAYSTKFHFYRHQPVVCGGEDWKEAARAARAYPEALAMCRRANQEFYGRVRSLLNLQAAA